MILATGETLVLQSPAYFSRGEEWVGGELYLSSRRVVFEAGAGGPNPHTAYIEGVEHVWNVHAGRQTRLFNGTREYLTIEGARGRALFQIAAAAMWAETIARTKGSLPRPAPVPEPHSPQRRPAMDGTGSIVVNIPPPVSPQVMMHCRHCGSLYDVARGRCDKCGAPPT